MLIVFLVILGGVSVASLGGGEGIGSLVVLPISAAVADLLFQKVRFGRLRIPDAAIATGLFLALLLPPTVNLLEAGAVTIAAVGIRHALRLKGRPWVNPAASGLLLGALLFGMAPAWWVAVSPAAEILVAVLGIMLSLRQSSRWRLPVVFFIVYAGFSALEHFLVGGVVSPRLLALATIDPVVLFFGLFMVTEPRTAPSAPDFQPVFATVVAIASAFLPLALPSLGVLIALFIGNLLAFAHRGASVTAAQAAPEPTTKKGKARRRRAAISREPIRWPVAYRAGSLVAIMMLLGVVALATAGQNSGTPSAIIATIPGTPPATGTGGSGGTGTSGGSGGGGGGTTYSNCNSDNPSIPQSTLQALHKALGPSVILSYDSNTGVVVFYDPVNHVTVTETDLYEDFGYAEFNGDDYAVSGCSP